MDMSQLRPLIDADILVYACGFAADSQKTKEIKERYPERVMDKEFIKDMMEKEDYLVYALANTKSVITDIQGLFSDDCSLYLTGPGNFREQLATLRPYKGNRDSTHKPKYYRDITAYLTNTWKADVVCGREADDALGCAQTAAPPNTTVIVSIDKDLDNIAGWHYNWRKKECYHIDEMTADRLFWTQVLTGDGTDNIPGVPGTGIKTAEKLIAKSDGSWYSMAEIALADYIRVYGDVEGYHNFYENASLLWIQREDNKNFDDNEYRYRASEEPEDSPPWNTEDSNVE